MLVPRQTTPNMSESESCVGGYPVYLEFAYKCYFGDVIGYSNYRKFNVIALLIECLIVFLRTSILHLYAYSQTECRLHLQLSQTEGTQLLRDLHKGVIVVSRVPKAVWYQYDWKSW